MESIRPNEENPQKKNLTPEEAELGILLESHPEAHFSTAADAEGKYNNFVLFAAAIMFLGFILFLYFFCTDVKSMDTKYTESVRANIAKVRVIKPVRASQKEVERYSVTYYYSEGNQTYSGRCIMDKHSAEKNGIDGVEAKGTVPVRIVKTKRSALDMDVMRAFVVIVFGLFILFGIMMIQLAKKTREDYEAGKYIIYQSRGRTVNKRLGH